MLKSLKISNYALIERVEIGFDSELSVITGETGAGKSILLGALALILGQRSDVNALNNKESKCVVEAEFDIQSYGMESLFEEKDVDYEPHTIIRREILPNGKSRAFVNDTPVNLSFLKNVSSKLIDVHSQHQNLLLSDDSFQLMVVDTIADNAKLKAAYTDLYRDYKKLSNKINQLVDENDKQKTDMDYIRFQYEQLYNAQLKEGELIAIEKELEQLEHAEEIKLGLNGAVQLLNAEQNGALFGIYEAVAQLRKIADFLPEGESILSRLDSAYIDMKDLAGDLDQKAEEIEYDPLLIQQKQTRVDLLYSLIQKHRVGSLEELIVLATEFEDKIRKFTNFDEELEALHNQLKQLELKLAKAAKELTKSRIGVFKNIKQAIESQLIELGMPHAQILIKHENAQAYSSSGKDEISILFSANKSGQPAEINKVASGGEMSRVMLSIKSLLSKAKGLPTLIFDEIDTGVSGEVADKMGRIMTDIAKTIQVITITHLPQIAVKGKNHYKVFKTDNAHQTVSQIKQLTEEERIVEVAKMLSGSELSDAALSNARSLLQN
ncbi:DNA repair protein RecN [Marinilabiliaceae bacterium JC017]|nr:DNA repair protein RecN [Marinilabiliaceae bacterium JC017]